MVEIVIHACEQRSPKRRGYARGVCMIVYVLSRGIVVLATRLAERPRRRARDDERGHGNGGGRAGRGGDDGAELVLAA